jgi:hypothetical protein
VHRERNLLQVIAATIASGGLTSGLDGRQKQGHQDANDGDNHQKLDQRKRASLGPHDDPRLELAAPPRKWQNTKLQFKASLLRCKAQIPKQREKAAETSARRGA